MPLLPNEPDVCHHPCFHTSLPSVQLWCFDRGGNRLVFLIVPCLTFMRHCSLTASWGTPVVDVQNLIRDMGDAFCYMLFYMYSLSAADCMGLCSLSEPLLFLRWVLWWAGFIVSGRRPAAHKGYACPGDALASARRTLHAVKVHQASLTNS